MLFNGERVRMASIGDTTEGKQQWWWRRVSSVAAVVFLHDPKQYRECTCP